MPQTLEEYKAYVGDRLQSVTEILPAIAIGDFSKRLAIPSDEDEFTELYAGINYLIEDLEENLRERKIAEDKLQLSEGKYRDIVELSPDGIITLDPTGIITSCNTSFFKLSGYSKKEIVGKHFSKLPSLHAKDITTWVNMFTSVLKGKAPPSLESEWIHKDGTPHWGDVCIALMKRGKNISGVQVITRDITERKLAEVREKQHIQDIQYLSDTAMDFVKLAPDADLYKHIAEHLYTLTDDSIVIVNSFDPETDLTTVRAILGFGKLAKSALKILGQDPLGTSYKINEKAKRQLLTGKYHKLPGKLYELTFGEMPKPICKALEKLFGIREIHSMGITFEGKLLGNAVIILRNETKLENTKVIETFIYQAAVAMQRRQAEEALRESEERYRLISENMIDEIWLMDMDMNVTFITPSVERKRGYLFEEFQKMDWTEHLTPESVEVAVEALDQVLTGENLEQPDLELSRTLDLEFNCKDGSTVWSEVTMSLVRDEHGVPMGLLGVARDVTERKRAEETLNNRLQFEHILSKISADLINSSYEGMDKSINEALKEVSQFTGAVRSSIFLYSDNLTKVTNTHEWCADPKDSQISLLQGIPADRFGYYFELLKKLEPVAIGNPDDMPTEAHGEREWIKEFGFRPLLFVPMIHEGALYGTVGFYGELNEERDWPQEAVGQLKILADLFVTTMERRKAEEDVRFQAMLLNQSSEYIISSDLNGCISYANEAFANALGRVPGELVGQTIDIFPEEPGELTNTEVVEKTIAEGYWKGERSMQIVDGSRLIIDLHTQILKDESGLSKGLFAIGHDITGKKKAVMALRESEEKYRNLIEGSHDLVQSVGLDGNFIFVNNAWRKTMGYPEHEIEGLKLIDIIHPESRARCQDLFQKVIAGQPQKNIEATFVSKDGRKIYVEGNAQPRRLGNKIIATQGFFRDITDRKKAEEQVRYQADLVENVSDAIISSDLEFNIVTWNRAAEALYGFKASDVIGKRVGDVTRIVYPYNSRDEVEKKFAENGYWKGEVIQRREDGEPLNILASVSMIRDSQGNPLGAVAINKDITKRKKMAEELLQSEKLASIGQLAAGMAHEVNTPLTNISLITENMMKMTNDPELMKKMKSLSEQRRHASNIVTSLLSFSRKIEPRMKMISLGNVLSDSISSLEKTKPKNIKIIKDFEKEIPKIKADHAQLRQAFTNLIDNAYDAMSEGGELTITANLKDESLVEVKFTDNGIGISMEDLEHVFDPFFTKKGVGDGVGLGLSICHGVIEAHKGTIRVESKEGKGTTFTITLPVG